MLHSENIESTEDGAYSGMWQVHGLSSVLKQCVVSIYPEVNQRYRVAFNRKCFPRELESNHPRHELLIMWTSTTNTCKHWSSNHFVPCFVNAQATIKSLQTILFLVSLMLKLPLKVNLLFRTHSFPELVLN